MRNIIKIILCLTMIVLTMMGCGPGGETTNVENDNIVANKIQVESKLYDEKDIDDAMDIVLKNFEEKYFGAHITEISYAGDEQQEKYKLYADTYAKDEVIVINTSIETEFSVSDDIPFDENSKYKDYPWVLARDEGQQWELFSWGY